MASETVKDQAVGDAAPVSAGGTAGASGAAGFDLEAAIESLLKDTASQTLDLPATLTPAERKHAKQVVESHPGLSCESFGFGAERQLRIFKKPASGAVEGAPSGVSVKNTFIDDWIAPEWTGPDQRAVQSMPHGMFGQTLLAEARSSTANSQGPAAQKLATQAEVAEVPSPVAAASPAAAPEAAATPAGYSALTPGANVRVHGLTKCPAFNGLSAVVQYLDESCGRYSVLLSTQQVAKIKAENLQLELPGPQQAACFGSHSVAAAPVWQDPAAVHAPPLRLTALV
eukprot:TRINITY_DN48884_c0_g1_i2.p1 TRINITY_DN48884_c0_g1~~TRINITY_DN48884_c0_g1_i2.p1  ORF type:complete len:285 (-),score=76.08 TRINITY_DN48884_c0_g1_i2:42-896(-)